MRVLLVFICTFLVYSHLSFGQYFQLSDQNKLNSLQEAFELNHVQFKRLHDSIPKRFPQKLIENLDPRARFFLKEDVEVIHNILAENSVYKWDQSAVVMDSCYARLKNRMFRAYRFLETLGDCDFTQNDSIHMIPFYADPIYYKDEAQFERSWKKNLKYSTLMSSLGDSTRKVNPEQYLDNLLSGWHTQIENSLCEIKTLLTEKGRLKQTVFDAYLNAYAQCFDPHSNYFSIEENEMFNTGLNTQIFTPGFYLEPNFQDYYVSEIIPNTEASKISTLHQGDKIVSVLVDSSFLSPACLSDERLFELFYGMNDSTITMNIQCPKDRITRTHSFKKQLATNSYNKSLSYSLESEDFKIGYIMLPSFYMDQDGIGDSSGQDLAAILLQMKSSNPDAVILDLRGNGGGSLKEAVDLAGFFADYGPLFLAGDLYSKSPVLIKDTKRGRLIDKKLVIMVNQFSASAAELVANTLQTYPDMLVVGNQTFGKSSGQDVIPLIDNEEVFGYAKVTSLEIFRFDGKTIQAIGAIPDIYIPSGLPTDMGNESSLDFTLLFEQPNKNISPVFKRREPVETLQVQARDRISKNPQLIKLKEMEVEYTEAFNNPLDLSLNYKNFSWPLENIPDVRDTSGYFKAHAQTIVPQDSLSLSYQIKLIEEDPVIHETIRIIGDWLNLNKN
ncbi:MAG: S41 family peptidase [Marinoscillum sp.]